LTPLMNRPRLLITLSSLFWAGNVIVGRAIVGYVPPLTLTWLRWTFATLFLLPVAWPFLRKEWPLIAKNWRTLLLLGIIGPACYNALYYVGLVSTEALSGLVISAAGPMFIALTARSLFGDRLTLGMLAGIVTGFAGVLFIITRGDPEAISALKFNTGDLLLLAAIFAWSVYTALLRMRPPISWQSYNFVTYAVAAFVNAPPAMAEHLLGFTMTASWVTVLAVLFVAIFPSLLGYIFYNRAVELLGPARAGLYLFLVPVFGALLATATLGERLHLFHAIGFALIFIGVLIGGNGTKTAAQSANAQ
jgi:drug/metabolite transporter (DMT)-like permease